MYNVTLRCVRATNVTVEEQKVLYIYSVCVCVCVFLCVCSLNYPACKALA